LVEELWAVLNVAPDELDADRCERLIAAGRSVVAAERVDEASAAFTTALELWRGPALSEFQYDAFAQAEIARIGELRAAALAERIAAEVVLGRERQASGPTRSPASASRSPIATPPSRRERR
jgi:hypothetical protein